MNPNDNDITLSSYVDGELDEESMRDVETFIETDANARKYVLNAFKTTARLRKSMNKVLYEEVPEQLLNNILMRKNNGGRRFNMYHPLFRMAAGILLILFGFGAGWLMPASESDNDFVMITSLPPAYNQIVQEALEYNVSGISRQWQSLENNEIIIVTPVRTYRNKDGQFFREFHLEVQTATEYGQVSGLAYRQNGEWKTKAVYFQ